jgi:Zn-dependent protease with chaperone function
LIQAAISRSREFNADTEGAQILGDPDAARQRAGERSTPPRTASRWR